MRGEKVVLRGRGSWSRNDAIVVYKVGGPRPYLWFGTVDPTTDDEKYLFSMSPGQASKLAEFLNG